MNILHNFQKDQQSSENPQESLESTLLTGICVFGLLSILYTFGLYKAFQVKHNTFVKQILGLLLLDFIPFTIWFVIVYCQLRSSLINKDSIQELLADSSNQWIKAVLFVSNVCYLQANWLFAIMYLQTVYWLNNLYVAETKRFDLYSGILFYTGSLILFAFCTLYFIIDLPYFTIIFTTFSGVSFAIDMIALLGLTIVLKKYEQRRVLKLNGERIQLHFLFLFILIFCQFGIVIWNTKDKQPKLLNILFSISWGLEFVTYSSLYFLLNIFTQNSASRQEVWCPILRKNVPPIVMMQNRFILRSYINQNYDSRQAELSENESEISRYTDELVSSAQMNLSEYGRRNFQYTECQNQLLSTYTDQYEVYSFQPEEDMALQSGELTESARNEIEQILL